MRSWLRCLLALTVIAATTARAAAPSAPGVSLNWDRCFGDGSVQYRNFACDVNTGTDRMVGSFELTSDISGVTGLEMTMDLGSSTAVPEWWKFSAPGGTVGCRGLALTTSFTPPPGSIACVDWTGGAGAGGVASYRPDLSNPNRMHVSLGEFVPGPTDIPGGHEMYAFTLNLSHTKSTGTGACAGCSAPVVIFLSSIHVVPATGAGTLLTGGANYTGSQWVSWQMGYPSSIVHGCGHLGLDGSCGLPFVDFTVAPYSATPTHNSTWGQVKSLYR